ncbi:hypothetical protein SCLCIDRAFT_962442 [Scleroderma citrinum Foug A]|uniref:Uncharacterized protein n=1 Tax=Scleroderma citrinum Foug A TaxID=1036808 RepID=A0A0C2ZER0_9AGAM|nr:hypothetical protein SCLCIDRAFT_962442 [Scleroderma citrinum Foug A]
MEGARRSSGPPRQRPNLTADHIPSSYLQSATTLVCVLRRSIYTCTTQKPGINAPSMTACEMDLLHIYVSLAFLQCRRTSIAFSHGGSTEASRDIFLALERSMREWVEGFVCEVCVVR